MAETRDPSAAEDRRLADPAGLAADTRRAGRLLLVEPDSALRDTLAAGGYLEPRGLEALRIEFADRLCHPESARYVAPEEHVFRRRWQARGRWHFPAPLPGGTAGVERFYARAGFDPRAVVSCAERPGAAPAADHLGVMLHFAAACLESGAPGNDTPMPPRRPSEVARMRRSAIRERWPERAPESPDSGLRPASGLHRPGAEDVRGTGFPPPVLAEFTRAHLGIWVEEFCLLLTRDGGGEYLQALADAAFEAVEDIRHLCTGSARADAG